MNQEWLIKNVLKQQGSVPPAPNDDREYLDLEEALRIVDETIDYLGAHGDDTEYTYISGHRKRLAHSLTMIPRASGPGQSCLDVGSYGYMSLWATKYLGYELVEGIEWHQDNSEQVILRQIRLEGETSEFKSHNFDISQSKWPIEGTYDTVLFFEVLEHINHDPMGVMKRIHSSLKPGGTLVMSVPNVISYKALKEFLVGMPPWTYWFYQPDLSHEPRHCFEYTPIIFKAIIKATGLRENAFKTIYAYTEQEHEQQTLEIARSFGFDDESFGETMIINATKISDKINLRYPDALYSPDGYYKNIYPHLRTRLDKAMQHFRDANPVPETPAPSIAQPAVEHRAPAPVPHTPEATAEGLEAIRAIAEERLANTQLRDQLAELLFTCDTQLGKQEELKAELTHTASEKDRVARELREAQHRSSDLEKQKLDLEAKVKELLFACDCYLSQENEKDQAVKAAEQARDHAVLEVKEARSRAEQLSKENSDLSAQVNELLFACDCYLKKESEVEPKLLAIEEAKNEALTESSNTRAWAEGLSKENGDLQGQVNELLFACDCYLQQVNDPARCTQVIREKRFRSALRFSKSVARKTPVLRTALRPVYRNTKKFIKRRM